jgi:hypothetical protein
VHRGGTLTELLRFCGEEGKQVCQEGIESSVQIGTGKKKENSLSSVV